MAKRAPKPKIGDAPDLTEFNDLFNPNAAAASKPTAATEVTPATIVKGQSPLPVSGSYDSVDLDLIEFDAAQVRDDFDSGYDQSGEHLELVATIKEYGILQPLLLMPINFDGEGNPHKYRVVFGERRGRAGKAAGFKGVPARIRELTSEQIVLIQIIENVQRKQITPLQEARGYMRLAREFGYTQNMIAKQAGKSQGAISRLLNTFADPVLKEYLESGQITYDQARELQQAKDPTRKKGLASAVALANEAAQLNSGLERISRDGIRAAVATGNPAALTNPAIAQPSRVPQLTNASAPNPTRSMTLGAPRPLSQRGIGEGVIKDLQLIHALAGGVAARLEGGQQFPRDVGRDVLEALRQVMEQSERLRPFLEDDKGLSLVA